MEIKQIKRYICAVMDHTDLVKVNMFRVTPQHSQYKVVGGRNWLVGVSEIHIQEILQKINNNIIIIK